MIISTSQSEFIPIRFAPSSKGLRALGIADRIDEVDTELRKATSFSIDDMTVTEYAKAVNVPTFVIQVHNDVLTKPSDVQTIFDNIPVKDKKLFWIEGTTRRFDGYNYLPQHPEQMIEWFDARTGGAARSAAKA